MDFLEGVGLDVSEEGYVVGLMECSGWDDNVTEGWVSVKIGEGLSSLGRAIEAKGSKLKHVGLVILKGKHPHGILHL